MKEQRRHLPKAITPLEQLDDRIVPSAMGLAAANHAALAEHSAIHATVQNHHRPIHAAVHHQHSAIRLARLHRQALRGRIHLAPQLPSGPMAMNAAAANSAAMNSAAVNSTPVNPAPATAAPANLAAVAAQPSVAVSANPMSTPAMSAGGSGGLNAAVPTTDPDATTTPTPLPNVPDVKNGPLANAGQDLTMLYQEFKQAGSGTFTSSLADRLEIVGNKVGIDAHLLAGDFNNFVSTLTSLGMQVQSTDPNSGTVEGLIPIDQLPNAAQNPQTLSLNAVYTPKQSPRGLL